MAAAVASLNARDRQNSIFRSVFPRPNFTTPTPETTPNIGTVSLPGRSFGGPNTAADIADESVKFNRAWSAVTRYLAVSPGLGDHKIPVNQDLIQAFGRLLESAPNDLVVWYTNELSVHFHNFVAPELQEWQQNIPPGQAPAVLRSTLQILQNAQRYYLAYIRPLTHPMASTSLNGKALWFEQRIRRVLHNLGLHSIPRSRLQSSLAAMMYRQMVQSLNTNSNPEECIKDTKCRCKVSLDGIPLHELNEIGLGGTPAEQAFAQAVHKFLRGPAIERRCFEVDWSGHVSVMSKLRTWIMEQLLPVIERALGMMAGNPDLRLTADDSEQFISMAAANLGRLRTLSMFDYVKTWPASTGAIQDVWEYLCAGSQSDKVHVCSSFSQQIQRRLLHAGASTAEILGIYVNVIHAFKALDSRGVLLEKVAIPIRNYLRARDDTVGIIAASFLADVNHEGDVTGADLDKICPDITIEVANSTLENRRDNRMLNWNDMEWMPDPIDAGPDYKSSRSEDVVAYILGLFEQEEFIKEVTTVLAQHLLNATDPAYVKEIRLVELFKSRLDASKLQAAEVMLRDMQYSVGLGKRINPMANYEAHGAMPTPREIQAAIPEEGITLSSLYEIFAERIKQPQFIAAVKLVANKRNDLFFAKRTRIPVDARKKDGLNFKAQILSSFFWPQLRSNEFKIPTQLETLNTNYEARFNALGSQQKLHFRPALAKVSVRLDLEDRVVEEADVAGWRASVIDLFTLPDYDDATGLTPEHIAGALDMDEDLVHDALNFWTSKSVLYRRSTGTYAVLERLDMVVEPNPEDEMQQDDDAIISAVKSQDAMLKESAPMFEVFIANMLRNQGPKQVGGMMGICSLLKMVLPSFTYGEEEVNWLLGQMEGRGEVVREGEVWKVV